MKVTVRQDRLIIDTPSAGLVTAALDTAADAWLEMAAGQTDGQRKSLLKMAGEAKAMSILINAKKDDPEPAQGGQDFVSFDKATATFLCDGCKVITGKPAGPDAPPRHWLDVTMVGGATEVIRTRQFCPACAPLVESYLQGRREEKTS